MLQEQLYVIGCRIMTLLIGFRWIRQYNWITSTRGQVEIGEHTEQ